MVDPHQVTTILQQATSGDASAADRLLPLVYSHLHEVAQRLMRRESPAHTLQATALVHEAYLRMVDQKQASYRDRLHFLAIGATAMRRVLIDHARSKSRAKRGGSAQRIDLEQQDAAAPATPSQVDLLALDEALTDLACADQRKALLVEYRFFGGMKIEEAAEALSISPATAKRDWEIARGMLYRRLAGKGHDG